MANRLSRGDVVLLREATPGEHADRAGLIWRVTGDEAIYLPIYGVRSEDRSQRHRAEMDLSHDDRNASGLPMRFPSVFCHQAFRTHTRHKCIGRFSDVMMARIRAAVSRELATQEMESRLSYRMDSTQVIRAFA